MNTDIYSEILKLEEVDTDVFYSVPLNLKDIKHILKLLDKDCSYDIYNKISNFLEDEYDILTLTIPLNNEH
jgi:hypothetical protein